MKLRSALTSSEDKINLLDHQLEEVSAKFSEEVRTRDESLCKQNSELESKANTIAMLTQQLYNTKIRLRNEIQAKNVNTTSTSHPTSSAVCMCPHCHVHRKKPSVTGERYYALNERVVDYQMPATSTSSRSRISRIQRRHFRNSSSPVAQDVSHLCDSDDLNCLPNKTSTTKRLPTPPLTPRPPPTTSPAPSMIRRASNPLRKQSPSPRSSKGQVSSGSISSVASQASVTSLTDENSPSSAVSFSTTSVGNERKVLDPVQVYRQGVMPHELRELLQSRESGGDLGEQLQQLLISKPAPLPPIVSDDDNPDETTPIQSEVFQYDPVTMMQIDPNNFSGIIHQSDPSSRFKGHHHPYPAHHHTPHPHPSGTQQHRHFILAKAQGLSSAPSTVRLLRYSPQQQELREEAAGSSLLVESKDNNIIEDGERGAAEGTLLIKETIDRKDSALQELHQR